MCESSALMWADEQAGTGISTEQHSSIPAADAGQGTDRTTATSCPVQRYARTLRSYKSPFIQVNLAPIFFKNYFIFTHSSTSICMETSQAENHHLLWTPMSCVSIVSDPPKLYFWPVSEFKANLEECITIKGFEILLVFTKLYLSKSQFNGSCKKCDSSSLLSMDRNPRARPDAFTALSITEPRGADINSLTGVHCAVVVQCCQSHLLADAMGNCSCLNCF